jgi:23S rRNA (guanine745-N1)-methyltransferase
MSEALLAVQGVLRCPHCAASIKIDAGVAKCDAGHSFDIARQGYVNFLTNHTFIKNADSAAMVEARRKMQARPYFQNLAQQLAQVCEGLCRDISLPVIIEPGGGTGFYARAATQVASSSVAISFDISVHAAKVCARQSNRIAAVVADVWQPWPIGEKCADIVLSVFSPRNFAETERVLKSGATLIVVAPEDHHLIELRSRFNALSIQHDKGETISALLGNFTKIEQFVHQSTELLDGQAMYETLLSGPNGHHLQPKDMEAILQSEPLDVTHSVSISIWKLNIDARASE